MSSNLREYTSKVLKVNNQEYYFYSLLYAAHKIGNIDNIPKSLKVLLENLIRWQDGTTVTREQIEAIVKWQQEGHIEQEIAYHPVRVLMQDFTGIPAIVDLAAMRIAIKNFGGNIKKINPIIPVDLVIDHSIIVDKCGDDRAFNENFQLEIQRNRERYNFLNWSQKAFTNLRIVPPGNGICHQINLEYLGQSIWYTIDHGKQVAYPDTLVGTDSHTTMINAMGILGWGVGGIEAEAAILGQPISMLVPDVVGIKVSGELNPGITATDLVLTVTQMLRKHGVVGKFVEFYGDDLIHLPLSDRATIANMAPEYGATCSFFPIDEVTINYMRLTGKSKKQIDLVESYAKAQGMWRYPGDKPLFSSTLKLNLSDIETSIAGPTRPQDRVSLNNVTKFFNYFVSHYQLHNKTSLTNPLIVNNKYDLQDGAIVIAAITSCTSTSSPNMLICAGLLAKKAVDIGLRSKPWVKTSLAPGSKVVSEYLATTGLTNYLNILGFNLVGYGCTTCIGNSGILLNNIEKIIEEKKLIVSAVLSGNRNFPGRIHHLVQTNWLASPPLVVAYAIAGNIKINLTTDPIGQDNQGHDVYLQDIWPSTEEIQEALKIINSKMFVKGYSELFTGNKYWQKINSKKIENYDWNHKSTYIKLAPFFKNMKKIPQTEKALRNVRVLAMLGDSITTDHISPAGTIRINSPAGRYLLENQVPPEDFNSYGARRGNYEVMVRGTFANVRIRNEILNNVEGGYTKYFPTGEQLTIYDAAMKYQSNQTPLIIIAGKEYGSGSSRDWAAKGPRLQGVRAVIAESFERIHRSNLIGMGILPLKFLDGMTRKTLQLTGEEYFHLLNLDNIQIRSAVTIQIIYANKNCSQTIETECCIYTDNELCYFLNGGILHYLIRKML